jgi:hypothetical protein
MGAYHHHLDLTTTDARSRSQLFTANVEQLVLETQTSLLVDRNIGDEQGLSFFPTSLTHRLINLPLGPIPHFDDHDLLYEMSSLLYQREHSFFLAFFFSSKAGATLNGLKKNMQCWLTIGPTEPQPQVLSNRVEDAFTGSVAHGAAMLPLPPLGLCQAQGQLMPMALDSYSPTDYSDQYISDQSRRFPADFLPSNPEADLNSKSLTEAGPAVTVPADTQKNNQEQIAALVSSREREVNELQTTLAVPLAHFNAKFIWHCIMNIERDCEYVFPILYLSLFIPPR